MASAGPIEAAAVRRAPAGARRRSGGRRGSRTIGPVLGQALGLVFGLVFGLAACVSTSVEYEDPSTPAVAFDPVVIPLPDAPADADRAVAQFYESVLARLQSAHQDGDLPTLRALVARYLRDDVPDWARERLLGFRALQRGLEFEQAAARGARLVVPGAEPAEPTEASTPGPGREDIGGPLDYELVVPAPPQGPWKLGGRGDDDPVSFRVAIEIRDLFVDGSERRHQDGDIVRLGSAVVLDREPMRLPLRLDLGPGDAVRRDVVLRVELLPGYVGVDDDRAPVRRTLLARASAVQWPPGHEAVRQAPMATLREAMRLGDAGHFKHVRLAAEFAAATDREDVQAALIDWVRLGRPDQALVAMATLRAVTGEDLPVGDREAWLAWWQARR